MGRPRPKGLHVGKPGPVERYRLQGPACRVSKERTAFENQPFRGLKTSPDGLCRARAFPVTIFN